VILLVDENVSRRVAERRAADGHTVLCGQDVAPGEPDEEVPARALALGAMVITQDTDFGELVTRLGHASAGVILLCLSGMARDLRPDHIAAAVRANAASIPGAFTVISPTAVRSRPLP
jgi:predicted nuclease of predicted toxin-antitoxin system